MTSDSDRHKQPAGVAELFTRMRQEDRQHLPPAPTLAALQRRQPAVAAPWQGHLGKVAVAASLALALGLWISHTPVQNAGAMYADIMAANTMETDALLVVSQAVLPESSALPGLYDDELPAYDADTLF